MNQNQLQLDEAAACLGCVGDKARDTVL